MEAERIRATSCSLRPDQQQQTNPHGRHEGAFLVAAFLEEVFFGEGVRKRICYFSYTLFTAVGVMGPGLCLALLCLWGHVSGEQILHIHLRNEPKHSGAAGIRSWAGS